MKKLVAILLGCLLSFAMESSPAAAFRLAPMVMDFAPSGRGATQMFGVINNGDAPIAVQVWVAHRAVNIDGEEAQIPEDDDFIVYPPQMVVMPGKVQTVQVRWIGRGQIERELPFRIIAEQLPISFEKPTQESDRAAQIGILFRYEGAIYVAPKGAEPDITLAAVAPLTRPDGSLWLEVILDNRGTSHGYVFEPQLLLRNAATGEQVRLSSEALGELTNVNVLAGHKRRIVVPWPSGLSPGHLIGQLSARITR